MGTKSDLTEAKADLQNQINAINASITALLGQSHISNRDYSRLRSLQGHREALQARLDVLEGKSELRRRSETK